MRFFGALVVVALLALAGVGAFCASMHFAASHIAAGGFEAIGAGTAVWLWSRLRRRRPEKKLEWVKEGPAWVAALMPKADASSRTEE